MRCRAEMGRLLLLERGHLSDIERHFFFFSIFEPPKLDALSLVPSVCCAVLYVGLGKQAESSTTGWYATQETRRELDYLISFGDPGCGCALCSDKAQVSLTGAENVYLVCHVNACFPRNLERTKETVFSQLKMMVRVPVPVPESGMKVY